VETTEFQAGRHPSMIAGPPLDRWGPVSLQVIQLTEITRLEFRSEFFNILGSGSSLTSAALLVSGTALFLRC
jgi:hypothetical protein